MRWSARRVELDLSEAARPFEDYDSLLAMFTRELKPGARPLDADEDALLCPVDARVGAFGRVESGQAYQAKGMDYALAALLGDAELAERFEGGHFLTLYLSPRDYHRMHTPRPGRVARTIYEPGTLWPVNAAAVRSVPSLFAVNERVTAILDTDWGDLAYVMVGATNVGGIRLAYRDFTSNRGGVRFDESHEPAPEIGRGAHLATFELGSTVVLFLPPGDMTWEGIEEDRWIAMGTAIARR